MPNLAVRIRVELDPAAFELFRRTPEMEALLRQRAQAAAVTAHRIAPDAPPVGRGYVAGIWVRSGILPEGAVAALNAADFKWHWIEFGSVNNPAHRVLGRALDSIRV